MAHLIWDWNGTLLDDTSLVVESVNASLTHLGQPAITAQRYRDEFVRPLERFYEGLLGTPVDGGLMETIDTVFHETYWSAFEQVSLAGDAAAAMQMAIDGGATQSIASMLQHDVLVSAVRRFGVQRHMLAVDGHRGLAGETKQQHLAEHLARLAQLHPATDRSRIVAIGDIVDDALAATSAGIGCVLYEGGGQARPALEATGYPVVGSLVEAVELALGN